MELSAIEMANIDGGFGILGSLIGSISNHFLSKDLARRNEHNQAVKDFIAAFQSELSRLKLETTSTYEIIKPAIIRHWDACSTFRKFLTGSELDRFDSVRRKYYLSTPPCPDKEIDQKYQDERTEIIEWLETLLDFAKYK